MNKIILLPLVFAILLVPTTVYGSSMIETNDYEMGDFLGIINWFGEEDLTIDIRGEDGFKKSLNSEMRGFYKIGLPLTVENGYADGDYTVILTEGDTSSTHYFTLYHDRPELTVEIPSDTINLNEYLLISGYLISDNPRALREQNRVVIQILDSEGNLFKQNWNNPHPTAYNLKSLFYEYTASPHTTDVIKNNERDKKHFSGIPINQNEYRMVVRMDQTAFISGDTYTVKVTSGKLSDSVDFKVVDYIDPVIILDNYCDNEEKAYKIIQERYDEILKTDAESLAIKLKDDLDNFHWRIGCEPIK